MPSSRRGAPKLAKQVITIDEATAVITMTLTSAACPLSKIMEDPIRSGPGSPRSPGSAVPGWTGSGYPRGGQPT
jgi:hypothetical protein